jgi:ABC-type lipoprotein export system ATPase subunit
VLVGQSGSGKTNILMNSTLARIQQKHEVHLVDQKNELAQIFERHVKVYQPDQTLELVRRLTLAAEDRMEHFGQVARQLGEPIRDVWEYEEVTGKKLPIIWLVLEELALVT